MMVARWLEPLLETTKILPEKEKRKYTQSIQKGSQVGIDSIYIGFGKVW